MQASTSALLYAMMLMRDRSSAACLCASGDVWPESGGRRSDPRRRLGSLGRLTHRLVGHQMALPCLEARHRHPGWQRVSTSPPLLPHMPGDETYTGCF